MIALVAGFLLVAYLLAPGAIYRVTFSFYISSKRFQRTRTEEIVFSVLVTLIPFLLTWILLLHTPLGSYPAIHGAIGKREAYSAILSSLLADATHGLTYPHLRLSSSDRRAGPLYRSALVSLRGRRLDDRPRHSQLRRLP